MSARSFRPGIWDGDTGLVEQPSTTWVWPGYLAHGNITLFTSQWKSGKTTLISLLFECRRLGRTLAGQSIAKGRSAIVSEESPELWAERGRRLTFGGDVCFFCQPFDARPTFPQWVELLDHLLTLKSSQGIDLVVIDPLASFLPGHCENHATLAQEALLPLRRLTRAGLAVALLHHPRKGVPRLGQLARGSGAMDGFADICVEMTHPGGNPFTRRRILHGLSRYPETPKRFCIELNATSTDYAQVPETADADEDLRINWNVLMMVLKDAPHPWSRRQIFAAWPDDFAKPDDKTLWRWLSRAVETGLLLSEGDGRRNDPFCYWLPENETRWKHELEYRFYCDSRNTRLALEKAGVKGMQPGKVKGKR